MLRRMAVTALLCLTLLVSGFFPVVAGAVGSEVKFGCPELQTAMEQQTGKKPVTRAAMAALKGELNLLGKNITSIEGLQYAVNIDRLVLTGNRLTDIQPVLTMVWLKRLSVDYNSIKNLTGIGKLQNLEELNISNNPLSSLPDDVCKITMLRRLYAGDDGIKALPQSIRSLVNLDRLYLAGNQLEAVNGLDALNRLELLDLSRCGLETVPAEIDNLTKLKYLYLSNNRLTELPEGIGKLPLERLEAANNLLSSLPESFASLTGLKQLVISGNAFFELPAQVLKLQNLEVLIASSNFMSELPPGLKNLKNLYRISFAANDITSLDSLKGMALPYPWQISFRYNRLDLKNAATKAVLKAFHHDALPQKQDIKAAITRANAEKVEVTFDFNAANWTNFIKGEYETGGALLFRKEKDGYQLAAVGKAGEAVVFDSGELAEGQSYEYLAALPLILAGQPSMTIYLEAKVKTEPLAAALLPSPTAAPSATPTATPIKSTAALAPSDHSSKSQAKAEDRLSPWMMYVTGTLLLIAVGIAGVLLNRLEGQGKTSGKPAPAAPQQQYSYRPRTGRQGMHSRGRGRR